MAPGITKIMERFKQVFTVELNYSDSLDDELINEDNKRFANLAWLLRARSLIDIDSFSRVHGQPFRPGAIETEIRRRLNTIIGKG
jgi:2-oxoglutarate ferredoxin oxidoreductase subunit alpha